MPPHGGHQLQTSSPQIGQEVAVLLQVEVVEGAQGGQFRLFVAGDRRHLQPRGRSHLPDEIGAVCCLPDGARGNGFDPFDAVAGGDLAEPGQGLQCPLPGIRRDDSGLVQAVAETDGGLFVVENPERPVRFRLHDDAPDGIGADVDGGQSLFH